MHNFSVAGDRHAMDEIEANYGLAIKLAAGDLPKDRTGTGTRFDKEVKVARSR